MTDFVKTELGVIRAKSSSIEGAELITCVPASVQIKIVKTKYKQLTARFQFPENYPQAPILIELVSRVLSCKLLDGLAKVCEEEAKKLLGQRQIIPITAFIRKFIDDNPLCVCSEEIAHIRKTIITEKDEIKLKQKTSQVVVKFKEGGYYLNVRLGVPDNYPSDQVQVELGDTNLPNLLKVNVYHQAVEISRKCVEPPLKKKPKDPPFEPQPSLAPVVEYLGDVIRKWPTEMCPCCRRRALPEDPKKVTNDENDPRFVERMYCLHLFHHDCLDEYMKKPPFTGGKKCPGCGNRIFHEKWKITPEIAEARWAHKEARHRELDEVVDFLE